MTELKEEKKINAEKHNIALAAKIKKAEAELKELKKGFKPITGATQASLQDCNKMNKNKK